MGKKKQQKSMMKHVSVRSEHALNSPPLLFLSNTSHYSFSYYCAHFSAPTHTRSSPPPPATTTNEQPLPYSFGCGGKAEVSRRLMMV